MANAGETTQPQFITTSLSWFGAYIIPPYATLAQTGIVRIHGTKPTSYQVGLLPYADTSTGTIDISFSFAMMVLPKVAANDSSALPSSPASVYVTIIET